tara:strand:- start:721 stop:1104 length:384 start_codon:yes stop_codon:yes gene_type:complete
MRLIEDYTERFHNHTLPIAEKCFKLEKGDELYIKKWITDGKINGELKDIFEWIEKKYLSNKEELEKTDKNKFDEIQKRFYIKNWRIILLMSEYQVKYRYYTKVVESIKEKSFSGMDNIEFLKLFQKD